MNSFKETAPVAAEGFGLGAVAGYVNVVVLAFYAFRAGPDTNASALPNLRVPVSHMTGAFSRLGIDLAKGVWTDLIPVASIVAGFFIGAAIAGAVIDNRRLHHAKRYGGILVGEGLVLLSAGALWDRGDWVALSLCALACGLQNAMTGYYRGMALRTTHVTGLVTDLATEAGVMLRGHAVRPWRMALQASILSGYFLGGVAGGVLFLELEGRGLRPAFTLLPPAALCMVAGFAYIRWLDKHPDKVREA